MSGNLWMFSDQLDDEDALMMQRGFRYLLPGGGLLWLRAKSIHAAGS